MTTTMRLLLVLLVSLLESNGAFAPPSLHGSSSRRAFVSLSSSRASAPSFSSSSSSQRTQRQSSPPSQAQQQRRVSQRKKKKTVQDRTQQETISLVKDVVQAVVDAGPRAGPMRTLQAQRAFVETAREFLPQLLRAPNANSVNEVLPKILRTLFERLGATYIKLGQFIASSPTLFPKEYVVEFQKCLDQTDPLPWPTIKRVIEAELGPLSKTFSYVDPKPLASASIAQVHVAQLASTGEDVVIKVQKPRIDESLKADLGFIYVAARVLEFLQPEWERTSLSAVAGDVRSSMLEELDFVKEAQNTIEFRRFLQQEQLLQQATAPRVYLDYTTKKVMTMERLNGVSMLDEKAIQQASSGMQDGTQTIITALNIWSLSVTSMPWFHADVHAGNLLLLEDGRVGFIDFGIVGRITPKVFNSVNELSMALAVGDSEGMAQALCNMGAADAEVDTKQFGRDIERVLERMNQVQPEILVTQMADGSVQGGGTATAASISVDETEITNLLLELVEVTEANGLKLPREFGLLVKQSLYFDRYLKILAPNVDVMNDSRVMMGGNTPASAGAAERNGDDEAAVARVNGDSSANADKVVIDV